MSEKNINLITSPTIETRNRLINLKIFNSKKIHLLRDPVLDDENFNIKNNRDYKNRYKFLAIGRLTRQKNFTFLINCFEKVLRTNKDFTLNIAGDGEEKNKLNEIIKSRNLQNNIKLIGFKKNIKRLYENHDCFILSSLWEDPGFVLIEAASYSIPVISSDCKSGPKEISNNGKNMFLYKNNNQKDFIKKLNKFLNSKNIDLKQKCKNSRKFVKRFTLNSHVESLTKILKYY